MIVCFRDTSWDARHPEPSTGPQLINFYLCPTMFSFSNCDVGPRSLCLDIWTFEGKVSRNVGEIRVPLRIPSHERDSNRERDEKAIRWEKGEVDGGFAKYNRILLKQRTTAFFLSQLAPRTGPFPTNNLQFHNNNNSASKPSTMP